MSVKEKVLEENKNKEKELNHMTPEQILDIIDEVVRNYPGNENDDNLINKS
jgi:hypothetical protein